MLSVYSLSHTPTANSDQPTLNEATFTLPTGHCVAVLGAAGSGKHLLAQILSQNEPITAGVAQWYGKDYSRSPLPCNVIGYVDTTGEALTQRMNVKECVVSAILLRVAALTKREAVLRADAIILQCGLDMVSTLRASALNTAQRRRLALAVALVAEPQLVVAEGFTEGVDARASRELAALLQQVARSGPGRVVLSCTQSLADLNSYDSVLVLHEGRVVFHGPGRAIVHYFTIKNTDELYHRLAMRPAQRWQESWSRHRESYYAAFKFTTGSTTTEEELTSADEEDSKDTPPIRFGASAEPTPAKSATATAAAPAPMPEPAALPSVLSQLSVLMHRRWTLLRRDKGQLWAQLITLAALPLLPTLSYLSHTQKLAGQDALYAAGNAALLCTVLQVFCVLFYAVRNGSRELAAESGVWRRERHAGLSPVAYFLSKMLFLLPFILTQSIWLVLCQEVIAGDMPGNGLQRMALFTLMNLASTAITLAFSARASSADQAEARSWLWAMGNVLLSGALLGLPHSVGSLLQPFTTAFYAWAGSVSDMAHTEVFPAIQVLNTSQFPTTTTAAALLSLHMLVGLACALWAITAKSARRE